MKAYIFPGQGAQFSGMGKELFSTNQTARSLFNKANEILGFNITEIMFQGTIEDLKQTKVTQPAIFLHSVALAICAGNSFSPDMAAGHSLGEFSALVAIKSLSFEDGLQLVHQRALAMQEACEIEESGMAAVLNLDKEIVRNVCASISDIVVPANFNSPNQIVISGSITGINKAIEKLKEAGAKRVIPLIVGGAFHSPLMEPAQKKLEQAIMNIDFKTPMCPIYQNVDAKAHINPDEIKANLIKQLTHPVLWTQTIEQMIMDGGTTFIETGPGNVLQGLTKKINNTVEAYSIQ
jgi:[acyl-carrier-protein] S-malonyltransferase